MKDVSASTPPARTPSQKQRVFILLGIALALIITLASGLELLRLDPGRNLLQLLNFRMTGNTGTGTSDATWMLIILRAVSTLASIVLPLYIIVSLFSKKGRQRLLLNLITLAAVLFFSTLLRNATRDKVQGAIGINNTEENAEAGAGILDGLSLPEFVPDTAAMLATVIVLAAMLALAGIAIIAAWWVLRKRRPPQPNAIHDIAVEAQSAIDTLRAGGAIDETVQKCYREMCEILQRERGLTRSYAMTASEFEKSLRTKGVPHDAVRQLTRLFEDIRYGDKAPGEPERALAIDSLSRIASVFGAAQ